jgi:hypothetical protein
MRWIRKWFLFHPSGGGPVLALVSLALAADPAGQLMVTMAGLPASGCVLSVDGQAQGKLPVRITSVATGSHAFAVECADGRTESWTKQVATAPGKLATLEIGPLTAPPPANTGTAPIETYVLLSRIQGEKVRVDGGEPVALPWLGKLVPVPHDFVVLAPDGTERARVTKSVAPGDGGKAVVKLD